jgi:peptidoglycan/xylan/chitin deacetylase (PgdA/CDA1 family)
MSGTGPSMAILMYHSLDQSGSVVSVSPSAFSQQMTMLADAGLTGISLKQAVAHREARGEWPLRSVVVTFDDGFANLHEHAVSALTGHGFGATVFLITGHMGKSNDWAPQPPGLGRKPILSWLQAKEMADAGIEMGAHTKTHPDLRRLSDAQVMDELRGSRSEIEERLGQGVETFAYPYGFVSACATEAAARTFRASCTTILRRASDEAMNRLPRIDAFYFQDPARFRALVAGGQDGYLTVRRWGRAIRGALVTI